MGFSAGTFTYSGSSTTFSAPTTGTTISSTAAAAAFTETATGLSTCLLKDGTQTATAAIPLAVAPSALTHAARANEVQNGYGSFLTSVSGTNTITATATPTPAYTVGQRFTFVPAVTNTGAVTLNISSLGAGAVQLAGAALTGGELVASVPVTVYVTAATPVFEIIAPTQFPDSRALVVGATDATKKIRFEADGITTGTTRVVTMPDADVTLLTGAATQAEQETGSSNTTSVTPGRQHFHPSASKCWVYAGIQGTALASYNVTSVTDTGTGTINVNVGNDFDTNLYAAVAIIEDTNDRATQVSAKSTQTCTIRCAGGTADPSAGYYFAAFGDLP
jgi:hypothetical protein